MTQAILGSFLAVLLSLGFAAVGEALLARRSLDLPGWNESFLIGSGTCAALIFPLSLAIPRHALEVELVLMALAVAWDRRSAAPASGTVFGAGRGAHPLERRRPPRHGADPVAVVLLAAIVSIVLLVRRLQPPRRTHVGQRAGLGHEAQQPLHRAASAAGVVPGGGATTPGSWPIPLHLVLEAVLEAPWGRLPLRPPRSSILPCLYASMLVGTYAAARTQCSRR
jgi:hypothetical protein